MIHKTHGGPPLQSDDYWSYLLKVSWTERTKWSLWNWFIMNPSTVPSSRTPRRIRPPPTVLSIPHAYLATFWKEWFGLFLNNYSTNTAWTVYDPIRYLSGRSVLAVAVSRVHLFRSKRSVTFEFHVLVFFIRQNRVSEVVLHLACLRQMTRAYVWTKDNLGSCRIFSGYFVVDWMALSTLWVYILILRCVVL